MSLLLFLTSVFTKLLHQIFQPAEADTTLEMTYLVGGGGFQSAIHPIFLMPSNLFTLNLMVMLW